jgi:hypothetical protein
MTPSLLFLSTFFGRCLAAAWPLLRRCLAVRIKSELVIHSIFSGKQILY